MLTAHDIEDTELQATRLYGLDDDTDRAVDEQWGSMQMLARLIVGGLFIAAVGACVFFAWRLA